MFFFIKSERVFNHCEGCLDETKANNLNSICIAKYVR